MDSLTAFTEKYGTYLEDVRVRVYRLVVIFAITFVVGFFSTSWLVKILVDVWKIENVTIVATSPFQLVDLAVSIGFFLAIIVILPLSVREMYAFLRTGLLKRERRLFLSLLPVAFLLFVIGFAYGVAVMYFALQVIAQVNVSLGVANLWDITRFVSQIMITSALLGVVFEFPVVLTFLIRLGIVPISFLTRKRRHAIVVILILVALLPPTDGISFIIMSVPLIGIYELTIFFNSFKKRGRNLPV